MPLFMGIWLYIIEYPNEQTIVLPCKLAVVQVKLWVCSLEMKHT